MRKFLSIVFIILGCALLAYPFISDYVLENKQKKQISELKETMKDNSDVKDTENKSNMDVFEELMKPVAILTVPKIDLEIPVYPNTSEQVLQEGVGIIESTDNLKPGKGTHTSISGHSGISVSKLFNSIPKLEKGDTFTVQIGDEIRHYRIFKKLEVLPTEMKALNRFEDKEVVSLMTCTPMFINSHRLFVYGERYEVDKDKTSLIESEVNNADSNSMIQYILYGIVGFIILILLGIVFVMISNKLKEKE